MIEHEAELLQLRQRVAALESALHSIRTELLSDRTSREWRPANENRAMQFDHWICEIVTVIDASAPAPAPERDGWRPIDSAPKMKVVLLLAVTHFGGDDNTVLNWKMATGHYSSGYDAWEWDGRILKAYDVQPTHWQPLPLPPSETKL